MMLNMDSIIEFAEMLALAEKECNGLVAVDVRWGEIYKKIHVLGLEDMLEEVNKNGKEK